jgi:hypothetical protein
MGSTKYVKFKGIKPDILSFKLNFKCLLKSQVQNLYYV